ncbi:MAG TPA: FtsX-like permease family protein [Clostridia bacterium]
MRALNKILIRDIFKTKAQFLSAASVVFAGILLFLSTNLSYVNLNNSLDYYVNQYKLLDYYADVNKIDSSIVDHVKKFNGIRDATGRISVDTGAKITNDKKVTARLISMPDNEQPAINKVFIEKGNYFNTNQNSCLIMKKFAEYHRLDIGSIITVKINNQDYKFEVSAIVLAPEYIYPMKSANSISTSAGDFGIIYIKESTASKLFGGNYNQLHVLFEDSANKTIVKEKIEDYLKPYGFMTGTLRKDQVSYNNVVSNVESFQSIAVIFPILFFAVAAFIIYISQIRLINKQRTSIGVMKALGYTNKRVLLHYMVYSILIAVIGSIPAIFLGYYLGKAMTVAFNSVFYIPVLQFKNYWMNYVVGMGLSIIFCMLAGYNSAKKILKIHPAEAMRAEAPKGGGRIVLERVTFFWSSLSFSWKIIIRNIFRNYKRSLFTVVGIIFTIILFMSSIYFFDSTYDMLDQHFFKFQKQDYKVLYQKPIYSNEVLNLRRIQGIERVEPIIEIPMTIEKDGRKEDSMIVGLTENHSLLKMIDVKRKPIELPESGILVSHVIADNLMIKPGDVVTVKTYLGDIKKKKVYVAGIVKKYLEYSCYMNLKEATGLLNEGEIVNGALIEVDSKYKNEVEDKLKKRPEFSTVEGRLTVLESFKGFLDFSNLFIAFMMLLGLIMGFAIVFNATVINIMERVREFASLKVLGFTKWEIHSNILRENLLLGLAAFLPGAILGRLMCEVFGKLYTTKLNTIEVFVYPRSYFICFLLVIAFILLAQFTNRKQISGLDMVEVLKNREG